VIIIAGLIAILILAAIAAVLLSRPENDL